jgi:predicted HTH transcriptional regulator
VGVSNVNEQVHRLEFELPKLISPRALWTVHQNKIGDRDVIIIEVPAGLDKPYVAGGAILFRRGENTVPATRDEISSLILKRFETSQRWERQILIGADLADMDHALIRETVRMAVESERWRGSPNDVDGFLNAFGLASDGEVTNAGFVLYGVQVARQLPQTRVRLMVMPKGKTVINI